MEWFVAIPILLSGPLNRWRGASLSPSHQVKRFVVAANTSLAAFLVTGDYWTFGLTITIWLGLLGAWGEWMDMGHVEYKDDLMGMTGRGLWLLFPSSMYLTLVNLFTNADYELGLFIAPGATMGLIYLALWKLKPPTNKFLDGPTSYGELGTGWVITGLPVLTLWF